MSTGMIIVFSSGNIPREMLDGMREEFLTDVRDAIGADPEEASEISLVHMREGNDSMPWMLGRQVVAVVLVRKTTARVEAAATIARVLRGCLDAMLENRYTNEVLFTPAIEASDASPAQPAVVESLPLPGIV